MSDPFKSLDESLRKHLPESDLKEVKRILYGRSDEYDQIFLSFVNMERQKVQILSVQCVTYFILIL